MVSTQELLRWTSLTAVVNELKTPSRFLKSLLFSAEETKATEILEIGILVGDRLVAPFVKRDAEAVEIQGFTEKIYNVEAPNIRIKIALSPKELLFERHVGHVIFAEAGDVMSAAEQHIARKSLRLVQTVDEAEEYLCAQAIRGSIAYSVDGEDAFTITYPRSSSHAITLSAFWDQAGSTPEVDFRTALDLVSEDVGLNVTHVILGSEATDAFLANEQVQALLDNRRIEAGGMDLEAKLQNGARRLGRFRGVEVWSYTRATTVPAEPGGAAAASFDLIRAKYAEFVTADPAAENVMYYGAISDLDAMEQGMIQAKRFSKSWKQPDPSKMWQLLQSRPLPVMRRPDSTVSMKVVSG